MNNWQVQGLVCLAATAHVGLVAMGAAGASPGGALAHYAAIAGTEGPYGFFAPGVAPELKATFEMEDDRGAVTTGVLETGVTPEADRRFKNIVTKLWLVSDKAGERVFSAAWAKHMLARHPSAKTVTVRVDAYDLPTMRAWQNGARPTWRLRISETYRAREKGGAS